MKMSVVIPTYNRSKLLMRCIISILRQSYKNYEIIIVNDGSNDDTKEIVMKLMKKRPKIKLFNNEKNRGEAASRNVGIKNAKGGVIVFVDDDCVANKNLLKNIATAFKKDINLAGVEGKTVPEKLSLRPFEHSLSNIRGGMYTTSNIAYRSSIIKKIGCDERLRLTNRVDADLAFSILERGGKIKFVPDAYVKHAVLKNSFLSKLRKKTLFMNDALILKKHKLLYKKYIKFPFERFTPLYVIFSLLTLINPYSILLLIATTLYELHYRKYNYSIGDFVKFFMLQAVGSWVAIVAVFYGSYKFRVNPFGFLK